MKLLLIFALVLRAFTANPRSQEIILKLQEFVDGNSKIYIDSKHCELTIYDKDLSAKAEMPENIISSLILSRKLPSKRYGILNFFHGNGAFHSRRFLLFNFNLNRSYKFVSDNLIQCLPDLTNSVLTNHPGLWNQFFTSNNFLLHKNFGFSEFPGLTNN